MSSNTNLRREYAKLATAEGIPSDIVKKHIKDCDVYGTLSPNFVQNYQSRIDYVASGRADTTNYACMSLVQGWSLLSHLISNSPTTVDGLLMCGRTETLATLCSEMIDSAVCLGISSKLERLSNRILEKLSPWCENASPLWATPTANIGLLSRIAERYPSLQILRSKQDGEWWLFADSIDHEPLAVSSDFGHLLCDALAPVQDPKAP